VLKGKTATASSGKNPSVDERKLERNLDILLTKPANGLGCWGLGLSLFRRQFRACCARWALFPSPAPPSWH